MSQNFSDDIAFRKRYSRFKIWISFKQGKNIKLYGTETPTTFSQMFFGYAKILTLDKQLGFDNCCLMAEKIYAGKYRSAIIYDRVTRQSVRKYLQDSFEDLQPVIIEPEKRYEYFKVSKLPTGKIDLQPMKDPNQVNFKSEILTALHPDKSDAGINKAK